MIQRTYFISTPDSLEGILAEIAQDKAYVEAQDRLLIVHEPVCEESFLQQEMAKIAKILPEAKAIGMTSFSTLGKIISFQQETRITLLLFKNSSVNLFEVDCSQKTPSEVSEDVAGQMEPLQNLKGIFCLTSNVQLCPNPLLETLVRHFPGVSVFGSLAGTQNIDGDESRIFSANGIYRRGVIFVAFCGADLHIKTASSIGWKPLGKKHLITHSDRSGFVHSIDGKPPEKFYERYLSIKFDSHFGLNIGAFPLIAKSGNMNLSHLPICYTEDGALAFSTELREGSSFHVAYAKPEYLLEESLNVANSVLQFQPEALLLYACIHRQMFLGAAKARSEIDAFSRILPNMCTSFGFGEILQTRNGGGIINASILAIAFREGKSDPEKVLTPIRYKTSASSKQNVSLSERLVSFLEATTEDLNGTIHQLTEMAEHDQLTQLFNRRKITEVLAYEIGKRRKDGDFSALMFDIDFFKRVNDTYGHNVGDQVLSQLSELVSYAIRGCDVIGRWGGEEFICILPNTKLEGAKILASRLQKTVESADFSPVPRVTISIGVTEANANDTFEDFLARLDSALYEAKDSGRNCIVCI